MKPVVYLEENEAWLFDGEKLSPCDFSEVKRYQAGASIPLSKLHLGSFKFLSSLSETELQIQTEIKMHEEGGLDSNIDYEITSFHHDLEFENSTLVEAFATSHEELSLCCKEILDKSKVIDWIVPSFITYAAYYVNKEIEEKTDLFFYLGELESYAVLFHKGQYIAHRRILSVEELAKETGLDPVRCRAMLSKQGLLEKNYTFEEKPFFDQLQLALSKQVEKIVHTINHKRGLFGIEGIDHVYVDFNGFALEGLGTIFEAYGMAGIPFEALTCKVSTNQDTHRSIKAMYIYLCANGKLDNPLNLSPYERQPVWYKRHSGHLILTTAAGVLISLLFPGYFYVQGTILDNEIQRAELQVAQMEAQSKRLGVQLKKLNEEVKSSNHNVQKIKDMNKVYEITIDTLPLLTDARYVRQKMMYDALEILKLYKLSTLSIEQNSTKGMNIHVIADYGSRENIANFMKKWMERGYSEARTSEIYLDQNIYESRIEVKR